MENMTANVESGGKFSSLSCGHSVTFDSLGKGDEPLIVGLLERNLSGYKEAGSVLASTFRRLKSFYEIYSAPGSIYITMRSKADHQYIGGAGLAPLAGLSPSEGIGEIRDLFITKEYRGNGLGAVLLRQCLERARKVNYTRLYLETTPEMVNAQKLFRRFGFRPVTYNDSNKSHAASKELVSDMPCYYMLESLADANP